MKIIASIYIYNFHIFISYLDDGINIIPFKDNRSLFFNSKAKYLDEIPNINSLTELQAKSHILFGTSESELVGYDLISENIDNYFNNDRKIVIDDVTQLSIYYQQNTLYAFAEEKGIFQFDISKPRFPQMCNKFVPRVFEKIGQPVVSNIESGENSLLIAIRNFGVSNITLEKGNYSHEIELRSEDPQDVKRFFNHKLLAVADSQEGLLLYDFSSNNLIKKIKLPNGDFPQQLEIINTTIIIKGTLGLYAYHPSHDKFMVLRDGKIGAMAVYYDYIFFTSKGKIFTLSLTDSFVRHGFTFDSQKFELELLKLNS